MSYTAEEVDTLYAKFEKCAGRQNANKASEVRLRAAERDLLQVAEKVRDLLRAAVKGDRALLMEVFGGSCTRFLRFREVIDTVTFSDMHANDQRWKDLSDAMATIEEVLKQLGMFKPSQIQKKAQMEIQAYRGLRGRFLPGERVRMTPECEGIKAEAWRVEPPLPEGLALHPSTGEITGMLKPGVEVPETSYTVTAGNEHGETEFELRFSVAPPAPKSLAYTGTPVECYMGEVVIWPAELQGGPPREWSVEPDLPKGLALDRRTGSVAGTPAAAAETTEYRVTAGNLSGQVSAVLKFAVRLAPPVGLAYPSSQAEYLMGGVVYLVPEIALKTSAPAKRPPSARWQSVQRRFLSGSFAWQNLAKLPPMSFSVEPALPDGLVLAARTGRISGKPSGPCEEASYRVTCRNEGGEAYAELHFAVRLKAPASLRYPNAVAAYYTRQPLTLSPQVDGLVAEWQVAPPLPAGLHLDTSMGIISGMPTKVAAEGSWVVTARNSEGQTEAVLSFAVLRAAPAELAYPAQAGEYPVHRPLELRPTVEGEVDRYTVEPALPPGLRLDSSTGTLEGTPTETAASTTYTVTASNETGAATTALTFCLKVLPPESLAYPQIDDVYSVGEEVRLEPQVEGGATSWTVEPPLPKGLALDAATGRIVGAALGPAAEDSYVVTATNEAGGTSVVLTFGVTTPRPEGLSYPDAGDEYAVGEEVLLEPKMTCGFCITYSVQPALPGDLELDPQTGVISGKLAEASDLRTYKITATNRTGSTSFNLSFSCVDGVDSITGVNQTFAQLVEEITDIADMVEEPKKTKTLGDWMVWMVHRAWLDDPTLKDFNFTGKRMPLPHHEPRIAPKLMKALEHNTNMESLQLSNSNLMKPQAHELAESLKKNRTLQVLNIESNNLDSEGIKHIAEALRENPNSGLECFRFNNQRSLGECFGRPVEQALAELMEKNLRLTRLGFNCADAHWRLSIDRALLRNNDLARRRRKGCDGDPLEEGIVAQEKPLSRLLLTNPPDVAAWEVFENDDERASLIRGYLASSKRLPTKEQLQSFAKGRGKPIPYSAVAPLVKDFRAKLLGAAVNTQVTVYDAYGAPFEGSLRAWSEKNERWSLDVWLPNYTRFNFMADKQPIIEVSDEVAAWQQPPE